MHDKCRVWRWMSSAILVCLGLILSASTLGQVPTAYSGEPAPFRVYLPLVIRSDSFVQRNSPIWAHNGSPALHEVVLFRHTFTPDASLSNATLHIFADTRYEVWIDGLWVGRGPARFSSTVHEYDVYSLGALAAGSHLIAVLVQWSPNSRRSESSTPFLRAHVEGVSDGRDQVIASTGTDWKARLSTAWRADAALVHTWGLIGSTELVDLRQLPANWMQPTYSDADWSKAVTRDTSRLDYQASAIPPLASHDGSRSIAEWPLANTTVIPNPTYRPRSISFLANVIANAMVIDAGLLSPGRAIGELVPPLTTPYSLGLTATRSTTLTVETLSVSNVPTDAVTLDGQTLSWRSDANRPDVLIACQSIAAGAHTLQFAAIPSDGFTFSVSTQDIQFANFPFQQGMHAGRRLLLAEPIRQPNQVIISKEPNLDVTFATTPAYIVLDLGRTLFGRAQTEVDGPTGTVMDIGWDERLWNDSRPLPFPGSLHPQWNQVDSWILDGTPRSISTIDARAGRYLLIAVFGTAPVTLRDIRIYEERYPVTPRGGFSSSDALLNTIWQIGVNTTYANMTDAYADPWRERGQWWGDAYVVDHANRVIFGDTALLRRGLSFMADAIAENGRPSAMAPNGNGIHMIDYAMLWVQGLAEYAQQTSDTQLLATVYPALRRFMTYLAMQENSATGLIDLPRLDWWETAYIDPLGYHSRYGQSTAVNAMYYGTLLKAAEVADRLGDTSTASSWRERAIALRQQINQALFLPDEHRYVTNVYQGIIQPPSPQAQALALAYGVVPESEIGLVASSLQSLLSTDPSAPNLETYGMFWVLEGLGKAGKIQEALDIIRLYYGHMINLGARTWWEHFNSYLYYWASLSHGWGSAPSWFLSTYVLGAQRTGPNTWIIRPAFQGVSQVSGALPLLDGVVQVSWKDLACEGRLDIVSPTGTNGEVVLASDVIAGHVTRDSILGRTQESFDLTRYPISPARKATAVLMLNNNVIWQKGGPVAEGVTQLPDGIHVSLAEGQYTLIVSQSCPTAQR